VADLDRELHRITVAEFIELLALDRISADLRAINQRLARLAAAVVKEGMIMTEVDDRLAQLTDEVGGLADDVQTELGQLRDALAGALSAEQAAKFDALAQKVGDMKTALEGDDTTPAPPTA
jgi:phosphoglycerate-specific signal transduction histidine kinase